MFDKLFVGVGNLVLIIYNFITGFKFPSFKTNGQNNPKAFDISQIQNLKEENNSFDDFRSIFLKYFLSKNVLAISIGFALVLLVFSGLEIALMFIVLMIMLYIFQISFE